VTLTVADPSATLAAQSGGSTATSNAFQVKSAAVASLIWGNVPTPVAANSPIPETITASDLYGNTVKDFNGSVNLSALQTIQKSALLLGTPGATAQAAQNSTLGYEFTPSATVQVTAVRSFFGSKVSIWTDGGKLLVSEPVLVNPGSWAQTPLAVPLTLHAGSHYVIAAYTGGSVSYYPASPPSFSWGAYNAGLDAPGDQFPFVNEGALGAWMVDICVNVPTLAPAPVTPTAATFVNGVWSGSVDISAAGSQAHLHADDGAGHIGDSAIFDVIEPSIGLPLPSDLREGDGTINSTLTLSVAPTTDSTITLSSSDPAVLSVPATVTIPAGSVSVPVPLTLASGGLQVSEAVTIWASAPLYQAATASILVHGDRVVALPPTASIAPRGSEVYQTVASGALYVPAESQNFTVWLDGGQTLTAIVQPTSAELRPSVSVIDPAGATLSAALAGSAGQDVVVQSIAVTSAGTYTIAVGGDGATAGSFSVQLLLSAAAESEQYNGPRNDTPAAAQDLTTAMRSLAGLGSVGAVVGALDASDSDWYSLSLSAGETLCATLAAFAGNNAPTLGLYDSASNLLASGTSSQSNGQTAIGGFVTTSAGTYFLQVAGSGIGYALVVTRNAVFDLEPNDSIAAAVPLGAAKVAIGAANTRIGNVPANDDYYSLVLSAGQSLAVRSYTPGDGPGEPANNLDVSLALHDGSGNTLATDDSSAHDGHNAVLTYVAQADGTYYLRVHASLVSTSSGEYVVTFAPINVSIPTDVNETNGMVMGTLSVAPAPAADLTVSLLSSDSSRIGVPATIVIPAGQTSVPLPLNVIDDAQLDGTEAIMISASADGYSPDGAPVTVHDDESASLSVSLPSAAGEGSGAVTGTITASAAPSRDIVVALSSSLPSRMTVPATVVLKAGQTTASFLATPVDNTVIDGTQTVTVSASAMDWTSGSTPIAVRDNDNTITFSVPSDGWEGQFLSGVIRLGGTLTNAVQVNLDTNGKVLGVTTPIFVPAGQTSVSLLILAVNDAVAAGMRTATITASAIGLDGGNASVNVHDVALDHLAIDPISSPQTAGSIAATVRACNVNNETIATFNGTGTWSAAGQSGSLAVAPRNLHIQRRRVDRRHHHQGRPVGRVKRQQRQIRRQQQFVCRADWPGSEVCLWRGCWTAIGEHAARAKCVRHGCLRQPGQQFQSVSGVERISGRGVVANHPRRHPLHE
jgi:hypothetical protein